MGKVRQANDYYIDLWNDVFYIDKNSPSGISWKINGNNKQIGKPVGWKTELNYWKAEFNTKALLIHRVVYFLHHGHLDKTMVVDHINGDPSDNSIENLRMISYAENSRNRKLGVNSKTGTNGVHETHDFIATWSENGKAHSKKFSVLVYGDNARNLAEAFRKKKINDLNNVGHNYTDHHGLERNI